MSERIAGSVFEDTFLLRPRVCTLADELKTAKRKQTYSM